ncbi:MAG TPA: hypothetical protein PLN54_13165 [Flavobacteriales bacterium]|nr:hypothetical protein [Flavobacteriales bacterium]
MPSIAVDKLDDKTVIVKQKYFHISILLIPVLVLLFPMPIERIFVGASAFIVLLFAFLYVTKRISIFKGSTIIIKESLNIFELPIKVRSYSIHSKLYNVSIEQFTSGGTSENTGIDSYSILLRDNRNIVAIINGFKKFKIAEEVAQKIRL